MRVERAERRKTVSLLKIAGWNEEPSGRKTDL